MNELIFRGQNPMMPNKHPDKAHAGMDDPDAYGEIYPLPPLLPLEQQAISLRIASALLQHAEARNLGQVLHTPGGILLSKRRLQPDVLFVARERRGIVGKARLHAPPDLIVDILSLRRQQSEFRIKKRLYAFYSIREYWVADPDASTIEVMVWSEVGYVSTGRYGRHDRLSSPLLPELKLPIAAIFESKEQA
jgi:Uma2 family endonuclease